MSLLVELFPAEDLDMLEGLVDARLLAIARWAATVVTKLTALHEEYDEDFDEAPSHSQVERILEALLSQVRAPAPTKDGEQ